jgi:hypothetical protein
MEVEATCATSYGSLTISGEDQSPRIPRAIPDHFIGRKRRLFPAVPRGATAWASLHIETGLRGEGICAGSVRCRIEVNGEVVQEHEQEGPKGVVDCGWAAPD